MLFIHKTPLSGSVAQKAPSTGFLNDTRIPMCNASHKPLPNPSCSPWCCPPPNPTYHWNHSSAAAARPGQPRREVIHHNSALALSCRGWHPVHLRKPRGHSWLAFFLQSLTWCFLPSFSTITSPPPWWCPALDKWNSAMTWCEWIQVVVV
jgi:hypothetical protein